MLNDFEQYLLCACSLYIYGITIALIGFRQVGVICLATSAVFTAMALYKIFKY